MNEVAEEAANEEMDDDDPVDNGHPVHPGNGDYSGYHSDSDSTVMMSGNSPFISKSARYNFLSRSGRKYSKSKVSLGIRANTI